MKLKDKIAIITGGGRGIGKAIAMGFASEGADVVITARTEAELESTACLIRKNNGKYISVVCDVVKEEQVKHLFETVLNQFWKINILVNNAGMGSIRPVQSISLESFNRILQVNLIGTFLCTKYVWNHLKDAGGGSIINISSLGGIVGPYVKRILRQ